MLALSAVFFSRVPRVVLRPRTLDCFSLLLLLTAVGRRPTVQGKRDGEWTRREWLGRGGLLLLACEMGAMMNVAMMDGEGTAMLRLHRDNTRDTRMGGWIVIDRCAEGFIY